jgi:hypothetical protein
MVTEKAKVFNMVKHKIDELIFNELLPEMFKRVGKEGVDLKKACQEPEWYMKEKWTAQDELAFKTWMVQKLRTKLKMTKRLAERETEMFLLNWGWTTGQEKQLELAL